MDGRWHFLPQKEGKKSWEILPGKEWVQATEKAVHREGSPLRRQVINQTSVDDIFVAVIPYD